MADELNSEQLAEIVAKQQILLKGMMATLNEYPDFFYICVHKSNQVIFAGTNGDPEKISIWLTDVMVNNPAMYEFFNACLILAKQELENKKG
jgi:hypothetical protein